MACVLSQLYHSQRQRQKNFISRASHTWQVTPVSAGQIQGDAEQVTQPDTTQLTQAEDTSFNATALLSSYTYPDRLGVAIAERILPAGCTT